MANHEGKQAEGKPSRPESIALKVYAGVAAVAAAMVARKLAEKAWVKATGKTPPNEPESPDVHWAEAVGWSLVIIIVTLAVVQLKLFGAFRDD